MPQGRILSYKLYASLQKKGSQLPETVIKFPSAFLPTGTGALYQPEEQH